MFATKKNFIYICKKIIKINKQKFRERQIAGMQTGHWSISGNMQLFTTDFLFPLLKTFPYLTCFHAREKPRCKNMAWSPSHPHELLVNKSQLVG